MAVADLPLSRRVRIWRLIWLQSESDSGPKFASHGAGAQQQQQQRPGSSGQGLADSGRGAQHGGMKPALWATGWAREGSLLCAALEGWSVVVRAFIDRSFFSRAPPPFGPDGGGLLGDWPALVPIGPRRGGAPPRLIGRSRGGGVRSGGAQRNIRCACLPRRPEWLPRAFASPSPVVETGHYSPVPVRSITVSVLFARISPPTPPTRPSVCRRSAP